MPRRATTNLANWRGLLQNENPLVPQGEGGASFCKFIKNLKPVGGNLEKILGYSRHSDFQYKHADRPVTLIRWGTGSGTKYFNMTAWDNLFNYTGGEWVPLLEQTANSYTFTPKGTLVNPNNTNIAPYVNYPFTYLVYNDVLYLTDGYNYPIKYDGTTAGTWGFIPLTGINGCIEATKDTNAAGSTLTAHKVRYKTTFYDSNTGLESVISTTYNEVTPGAGDAVNVYPIHTYWNVANGYTQKNGFADKLRFYRAPGSNAADADDDSDYYLLSEQPNVPIAGQVGTDLTDNGATGTLEDTTANFTTLGVVAGMACYLPTQGRYYRVTAVPSTTTLTLVDIDDTNDFTLGAAGGAQVYTIIPMAIDNVTDISANTKYYGDDTTVGTADDRDHNPPPLCKYCIGFGDAGNRVFMAGDSDYPNRLYYSNIGLPDYFPLSNWIDISPDDGDGITGLFNFQGRLLILKRNSIAVANIQGDPVQWKITSNYLSVGAEHQHLITDCNGILIFVNKTGVYAWDGGTLSHISHNRNNSNIIYYWDNQVVLSELEYARAVFNKKTNEFWVTLTLDDDGRDSYDSSETGEGDVYNDTTVVASDGGGTPQNNGTFVFTLDTADWYYQEAIDATCWCVFENKADSLELLGGRKSNMINTYNNTETTVSKSGYVGKVDSGTADTMTQSDWTFVTDYMVNYKLLVETDSEPRTIVSNTPGTITIDGTFDVTPAEDDLWSLLPIATTTNDMDLYWESPEYIIGSYSEFKSLYDGLIRCYGNGLLNIAYEWDGLTGTGGSFNINLTQAGTTVWGEDDWASDTSGLVFSDVQELMNSFNFPQNKGRHLKLKMTLLNTSFHFYMNLFSYGWILKTNGRNNP